MDGVLADFMASARHLLFRLFPRLRDPDVRTIAQSNFGLESLGVTKEEEVIFWQTIRQTPDFWYNLAPLPNTTFLYKLDAAHRLFFITNRFPTGGDTAEDQTRRWLQEKHGLVAPKIYVYADKSIPSERVGLDYMIDDKPENLDAVLQGSPNCRPVLLDATYNRAPKYAGYLRFCDFNTFALQILGGK